jgi:hypothetical protein
MSSGNARPLERPDSVSKVARSTAWLTISIWRRSRFREAIGLSEPALHVRPHPHAHRTPTPHRLREVIEPRHPVVHSRRGSHPRPLGDLRCRHQRCHIDAARHDRDRHVPLPAPLRLRHLLGWHPHSVGRQGPCQQPGPRTSCQCSVTPCQQSRDGLIVEP